MDKNNFSSSSTSYYTTCKNDLKNPENMICKEEKRTRNPNGEISIEVREFTKENQKGRNREMGDPLNNFFGLRNYFSDFEDSDHETRRPIMNQFDEDFDDLDRTLSVFMPLLGNFFSGDSNFGNRRRNARIEEDQEAGPTTQYFKNKEAGERKGDQFYMNRKFNDSDIYDL